MKKHFIRLLFFTIVSLVGLILFLGYYLSKPANKTISMPKGYTNVFFKGTHGSVLKADNNKICALLMHGVRSNRTSMIKRSIFLKQNGITSLLIDLQAHGETIGNEITFGIKESIDANNGVEYLREKQQCGKVFAIGQSLGGASALLGDGPIKVDALILESVYPTIVDAVENRLEIRLGRIGRLLAPLLYIQIPLRIDATIDQLRPIDSLKKVRVPIFIISGSNDHHTKITETKQMYEAANEPKRLWLVAGAKHQDLLSYRPSEYKANIIDFIEKSL